VIAFVVPYQIVSYRGVCGCRDGREYPDNALATDYPRRWRGAMPIVGMLDMKGERSGTVADGLAGTFMVGESGRQTPRQLLPAPPDLGKLRNGRIRGLPWQWRNASTTWRLDPRGPDSRPFIHRVPNLHHGLA
jgi:hypothetical protein